MDEVSALSGAQLDQLAAVRGHLAAGQRQLARALAHERLDSSDNIFGALLAGVVAVAEGFREFGLCLFDRVPRGMLLAGAPAEFMETLLHLRPQEVEIAVSELRTRHQTGIDAARLAELRSIARRRRDTASERALSSLPPLTDQCSAPAACVELEDEPRITVLDIRPSTGPSMSVDDELTTFEHWVTGSIRRLRQPRHEDRNWWAGLTRRCFGRLPVPDAPGAFRPIKSSGTPRDGWFDRIVVVPGGKLDVPTSRWLTEALPDASNVFILGLEVTEFEALTEGLLNLLRRNQPVGAADPWTAGFLSELGLEVFVSGKVTQWTSNDARMSVADVDVAAALDAVFLDVLRQNEGVKGPLPDPRQAWVLSLKSKSAPLRGQDESFWQPAPASVDVQSVVQAVRSRKWESPEFEPMRPGRVEVALAVDDRLQEHLYVVIESALRSATEPVRFHVLTRGLTVSYWRAIAHHFRGRAAFGFYPCDAVDYGKRVRLLRHTTLSTIDRLLLPHLLFEVDRSIYLDIDVVVMGDLGELWGLDVQGLPLAARPSSTPGMRWGGQMLRKATESCAPEQAQRIQRWLFGSGPMMFRAFNAGVLLMNLKRMRDDGAVPLLLSLVEHCAMNDQDALNIYTRNRYLPLATEWNAAPRQEVTDNAKIIHFVGPVKPWDDLYISRKLEFDRLRECVERRRRELELE